VVIFITLLAGFVAFLQVTFFPLFEDFYPGRLAVKYQDKTPRITGVILIIVGDVDEVECNVWPLEVCGLLLGRPW
jgi:hypothetical protein